MNIEFKDSKRFVTVLKVLSTFAHTDEKTRKFMTCVHVNVHATSLDLVATDGGMLAMYRWLNPGVCNGGDQKRSIPLSCVKDVIKGSSAIENASAFLRGGGDQCRLDILGASYRWADVVGPQGEDAFPLYEEVIPQVVEYAPCVFDAMYIERAAKAFVVLRKLRGLRGSATDITLKTSGDASPLIVTSNEVPELLVVVMPLRHTYNHNSPRLLIQDHNRLPGDSTDPV